MKIQDLRNLIREEVRRVLKENTIADLEVSPEVLKVPGNTIGSMMIALDSKYGLKLLKKINSKMADHPIEISQIVGTSYIVVDEAGFGVIFKASDMPKVVAAIKDGSYFEMED